MPEPDVAAAGGRVHHPAPACKLPVTFVSPNSKGTTAMSSQIRIVRGVMCSVLLLVAACAVIQSVSGEPGLSGKALLGNKCILCNSYSPTQAPRICNSCNSKFSNKCILCNAYSPTQVPRICNSCNSKH